MSLWISYFCAGKRRNRGWEEGGVEGGGRGVTMGKGVWPWGKGCGPGGKTEPKCFQQHGHNSALNMVQLLYRIMQSFSLLGS